MGQAAREELVGGPRFWRERLKEMRPQASAVWRTAAVPVSGAVTRSGLAARKTGEAAWVEVPPGKYGQCPADRSVVVPLLLSDMPEQWCLPPLRQQAGSADAVFACNAGPISEKLNSNSSTMEETLRKKLS